MDDLISRQAAIEALSMNMPKLTTPDGCGQFDHEIEIADEAFVDCMRIIDELPSAEPHWIPVSERLPEDGQYVLFCDIDEDIMLGYHVKGRPDTHFSQDGSWDDMKNVLAWMPLPKSYRGNKDDE